MAPKESKEHEKKSKKGAESVSPTPQNAESPESSVDESVVTKKRTTMSQKAGIIFPVKKVLTSLKKIKIAPKIREGAAVYMAGVLEYLSAEILELAGNAARDNHRQRINPRHITLAIRSDEELNDLLKDVIIPEGGVLPHVESALLPARTKIPHSPANE